MTVEQNPVTTAPAAPAAPSAAPAPASAPVQPTAAPSPESDLRAAMQKEVQRLADRKDSSVFGTKPGAAVEPVAKTIAELTGAVPAPAPAQPTTQPPTEEVKPETPAPQAEAPKDDQAAAVFLPKFGREFSKMELEAALEGYNYYHPKVMQLNEDFQRVQQEFARVEQMKSAPEMVLVDAIRGNPDLKRQVLDLVSKLDPAAQGQYQANQASAEQNQELTALKQQIAELQGVNQQAKQAAWQNHVQTTVQTVGEQVNAMVGKLANEGVQISEQDLQDMTGALGALVQAGRLQYEPKSILAFYQREIGRIASAAQAAKNHALSQYHNTKTQAPPPPPSGGSAQALGSPTPRSFREATGMLKDRLEVAMRSL